MALTFAQLRNLVFGTATNERAIDKAIVDKIEEVANSGPGGGIQSVVPGTGIGVDVTDPANPVVSAILIANNGLSIDGSGNLVLGQDIGAVGDPAALLSNREIPLGGFYFAMVNNANFHFIVEPDNYYALGDIDSSGNGMTLDIFDGASQIVLGAFPNSNGTKIFIDDSVKLVTVEENNLTRYLLLDAINSLYQIGDINGSNNGTALNLYDNTKIASIVTADGEMIYLDQVNGLYQIGDLGNTLNNSFLSLNDISQTLIFSSGIVGDKYLSLDVLNQLYQIGDLDNSGNDLRLSIDDSNQYIYIGTSLVQFLTIDIVNNGYQFGDNFGTGNQTCVWVDDTNQRFVFQSGAGATAVGGITTNLPSVNGAGLWLLGKEVVAAAALDATKYLEVMVDGNIHKIALIQ